MSRFSAPMRLLPLLWLLLLLPIGSFADETPAPRLQWVEQQVRLSDLPSILRRPEVEKQLGSGLDALTRTSSNPWSTTRGPATCASCATWSNGW